MRTLNAIILVITLQFAGCTPMEQAVDNKQPPVIPTFNRVEEGEPVEVFIFISESEQDRIEKELENLMLAGLPDGSLCHLVASPSHVAIGSVNIPYGPPKTRLKNRLFQNEFSQVLFWFTQQTDKLDSPQLGTPDIAETIKNLRRTEKDCWIVLCGTPIFDEADEPTFSMADGLVPSHGIIGNPQGPWRTATYLPNGAKISWLTAENRWGKNPQHRQAVSLFYRVYFNAIGGHLIRYTPDATLAFSFAEPHLPNNVVRLDEEGAMINPRVKTELGEPETVDDPVVVPIKKAEVSLAVPGSILQRIEMAGGDVSSLAADEIAILLVYDASGSMAGHLADTNATLMEIAKSLPRLARSVEIGICIHRESETESFPITQILDSELDLGASLRRLETFLAGIQAKGGDATSADMLSEGMTRLSNIDAGKRQILMVVTDVISIPETPKSSVSDTADELIDQVKIWSNQQEIDRRVISMYRGERGGFPEMFFRAIGRSNANSLYSRDPNALIESILATAISSPENVDD